MKRLLLALALAVTTPALAAPPPEWATLTAREARASQHIDAAQKDGRISDAEADRLRRQLHKVESLRLYYRKSHGMSAWERRDLERRLKAIDTKLAKAKPRP
jgi:hypothetical protein